MSDIKDSKDIEEIDPRLRCWGRTSDGKSAVQEMSLPLVKRVLFNGRVLYVKGGTEEEVDSKIEKLKKILKRPFGDTAIDDGYTIHEVIIVVVVTVMLGLMGWFLWLAAHVLWRLAHQ